MISLAGLDAESNDRQVSSTILAVCKHIFPTSCVRLRAVQTGGQ